MCVCVCVCVCVFVCTCVRVCMRVYCRLSNKYFFEGLVLRTLFKLFFRILPIEIVLSFFVNMNIHVSNDDLNVKF